MTGITTAKNINMCCRMLDNPGNRIDRCVIPMFI